MRNAPTMRSLVYSKMEQNEASGLDKLIVDRN